jgi:hypothetical protein
MKVSELIIGLQNTKQCLEHRLKHGEYETEYTQSQLENMRYCVDNTINFITEWLIDNPDYKINGD